MRSGKVVGFGQDFGEIASGTHRFDSLSFFGLRQRASPLAGPLGSRISGRWACLPKPTCPTKIYTGPQTPQFPILRFAVEGVRYLGKDQENRDTGNRPCPDFILSAYFYSMLTAVALTNDRESPLVERWVA